MKSQIMVAFTRATTPRLQAKLIHKQITGGNCRLFVTNGKQRMCTFFPSFIRLRYSHPRKNIATFVSDRLQNDKIPQSECIFWVGAISWQLNKLHYLRIEAPRLQKILHMVKLRAVVLYVNQDAFSCFQNRTPHQPGWGGMLNGSSVAPIVSFSPRIYSR